MYNRGFDPGWRLVAMNDPSKRRGIWYRPSEDKQSIELCAGREGDDAFAFFRIGETVTPAMLDGLYGIMEIGAAMVDEKEES